MLELYHAPQSTCSQKVRIALAEKNLDWTERRVNLPKNEQLRPEYLKLNPNGVVPTLVHDGQVIIDSSVILEYLDEVFPKPLLSPADPARRAQMRAWMRFLEEVPTAAIRVPSFHMALANRFNELDEKQFRASEADVRPVRKNFYRRMGPQGFSEEDVAASLDELKRTRRRAVADGAGLYPCRHRGDAEHRPHERSGIVGDLVEEAARHGVVCTHAGAPGF
jgi:glutathione S-transferase